MSFPSPYIVSRVDIRTICAKISVNCHKKVMGVASFHIIYLC